MNYTVTAIFDPDTQISHTIEAEDPEDAADIVFVESNRDGRTALWGDTRSLSVGDVVQVQDTESTYCFVCLPIGWMIVEREFVDTWMLMPFQFRLLHPLMHTSDVIDAMLIRRQIMRKGMSNRLESPRS